MLWLYVVAVTYAWQWVALCQGTLRVYEKGSVNVLMNRVSHMAKSNMKESGYLGMSH